MSVRPNTFFDSGEIRIRKDGRKIFPYHVLVCQEKMSFTTKAAARIKIREHTERKSAYRCPVCLKWHIGSSDPLGRLFKIEQRKALKKKRDPGEELG